MKKTKVNVIHFNNPIKKPKSWAMNEEVFKTTARRSTRSLEEDVDNLRYIMPHPSVYFAHLSYHYNIEYLI